MSDAVTRVRSSVSRDLKTNPPIQTRRRRHTFEYILFLSLAALIRAVPLELASSWSGFGWRFIARRLYRHKRAIRNLTLSFPDKTSAEIEQMALGMWDNLGRTFAEFFHMESLVKSDRIQMSNPELFDALRGPGGSVVCCLHMGNWEIASQAGLRIGWRPAGVYQKITNPFVDRFVKAVRGPLYPGGLMEKSSGTARALLRYARQGGCIAIMADQRTSGGVPSLFFGRAANSTPFPAYVARSINAPLYVFGAKRLEGARFSIQLARFVVPRTADSADDVTAATKNLQSALELMIREAPEQWMWAHRRWD
jgi:Kdo2-lipid IVA lauroyltransferase/acyltransferase